MFIVSRYFTIETLYAHSSAGYKLTRILAFNPTYWKNWPTLEGGNNYVQPPPWWQQFIEVMCNIEPA